VAKDLLTLISFYIIYYRRKTFKLLHNTLLSITKFLYKNVRKKYAGSKKYP
jgi:hypothetical protein